MGGMKKYRPRRYPLLPRRQPLPATGPALPLQGPWPDWPAFWRDTSAALQQRGYARSTLLYYRQILRAFSQQAAKPLSARSIERRIRELATAAGIERPVTAMTLRHTFAVVSLRTGMSLPELQQRLGHKTLEATARYLRCLLPSDAASPLDIVTSPHPFPTVPQSEIFIHQSPIAPSPLDALANHRPTRAQTVLDVIEESIATPNLKSPITNLQFLKARLKSGFLRLASCLLGT